MASPSSVLQLQSWLVPAGPAARRIAELWWPLLVLAVAITIIVLGVLVAALFRRREGGRGHDRTDDTVMASPDSAADRRGTRLILLGGAVVPAVILIGIYVFSLLTMRAIDAGHASPGAFHVDVTGKQWWWHVAYPDSLASNVFVSANEIRIPAGQRVVVRLASDDVIHSFWVPELQGKTDLIPGRRTVTWIQADTPGVYRGQCAEFCGVQHARMRFVVIAMAPDDFAGWLAEQRRPAREPRTDGERRGREVFLSSGCLLCHAIRGTPAGGDGTGPDLTHVAGRTTLAAGLLPNTPGHLAGWITNPQQLKPGALMPRVPLEPDALHALVAYLQSLR